MKFLFTIFTGFIFCFNNISAQQHSSETDPFHGNYNLGSSSEIVLFWHYQKDFDSTVYHKIFDYYGSTGNFILDSSSEGSYTGNLGSGFENGSADFHFESLTGDFDGDGFDNIISAWETTDNSINIIIPEISKSALSWNEEKVTTFTNILYPDPNFSSVRFRLIKGYFDKDSYPEIALAFWNKDGNIEIKIFDVDSVDFTISEKTSIADEYSDPAHLNSGLYDIAAGDFDGDLRDEIILAGLDESGPWAIFTKVYDVTENSGNLSLVPKVKKNDFYTRDDFFDDDFGVNNLAVSAGGFLNNTLDQFVVDFVLYENDEINNKMLTGEVNSTLDTINADMNNVEDIFQTLGTSYIGIGVLSGDINGDGRDEIVIDSDGRIRIYAVDDSLALNLETSASRSSHSISRRSMMLADLDASTADSVWNPEIIYSYVEEFQPDNSPFYRTLEIDVYQPVVDASNDIISLPRRVSMRVDSMEGLNDYFWSLTAGDFDGGGVRLGKPSYYSATDIVQPLVILNAPPTHFDVLDDVTYDINKSYNQQTGNFFSQYYTSSEEEINVESEVHSGWTIGGSVSGTLVIPKLNIPVAAKLEGEYGENFSKKTTDVNIYRINQNISANNDDYIYAIITDYDIWEYPIITNDTLQGYTLVVSPRQTQRAWFPSKSPQAAEYLPDHEVGNILSYNQISNPNENSTLKSEVKWNTSDEVTLDGSPGFQYNWSLENENSTETTETNKVDWNVSASAGFDIPFKYIPNFEIKGDYSSGSISTQTNKVTYTKGLNVHLGPIDLGIGETYYSVTPYAYWAKSGALVLDYAVNPRPSGINVPQTWWQQQYGSKPDPALILPWRLDNEKGFNVPEDKRFQTKEIIFNPDEPKPGETVNIQTRIHNYSLLNTSGPVNVQFYLGDPDNGGTLIESDDGKTIFSTDDFIAARGSKIINFDWTLPENTPYFPRIYVVLDPDNEIDEIHETNNKGWKVLNFADGVTGVEDENIVNSFELLQNYPNPFNPNTTLSFVIGHQSFVSLKVYDILGSEITTLVNKEMKPGRHSVNFDASSFASGVYFYRIRTGNFVQTKKMILMK